MLASLAKGNGMLLQIGQQENEPQGNLNSSDIEGLLSEFRVIFKEPQGLLPLRNQDHKIALNESTQPISTRPYRYLYYK